MREALADLPGLDRPAQFEPSAAAAQGQRPLLLLLGGFLLVGFSHALRYHHPVAPARPARNPSCVHPYRRAAARRPTSRDRSTSSRRHSGPPATTACTIRSRPNAPPSSAAVSTPRRRQIAPERGELAAPALRAVERKQQQPGPAAARRLAHPLEPGHRQTGPAGETEGIATPPRQQALDAVGKLGRRRDRPSRRPREDPLCHRPFHYIAARRQPQTPSGKPRLDIGHDRAVRGRRQNATARRGRGPRR